MKTLIIPADLSNNFYNSLNFALMFEQSHPTEFIILFENQKYEKEYLLKFEEIVVNYQPALCHTESIIRYHITTDRLEDEICMLIDENKDSIFFRTYLETNDSKQSGYTKENALRMIKYTSHNVFTLPANWAPSTVKRIIFPIHHLSKVRHKVTLTAEIAKLFGSEIHVINAQVTNQNTVMKQCTLYARQVTKHFRSVGIPTSLAEVKGKNLAETILDFAESNNGDIISVIMERNSGGLFGKSYLQEMVTQSNIPLLVVAPRKSRITGSFKTSG